MRGSPLGSRLRSSRPPLPPSRRRGCAPRRSRPRSGGGARLESLELLQRPLGVLPEQGVRPRGERFHTFCELPVAGVARRDEGVPAQVAGVVAREVQAVVTLRELVVV